MVSQAPDTSATESESSEVTVTVEEQSKPIRLSREDLYELAWSKPLSSLAQDFGISDVALAKRCRRLGIPIPGRGYWARVDAGQTPYRPKLPKREDQWQDQSALTVGPSHCTPVVATVESLTTLAENSDPNAVSAQITTLVVESAPTVLEALAPVKRTALYVDQLDPLSSAPRVEDFERPTNEYGGDDDKWKKGVARLLGAPWKEAWKIGKDYTPPPRDPHDYWYSSRERSVFEVGSAENLDEDDD